jgi:copper(I)-binding protein
VALARPAGERAVIAARPLGWSAVAVALGVAGLIVAAVPQSSASSGTPGSARGSGEITVTGAYVRANLPGTHVSAAYFTVYNTTSRPDRIVSVETGAGESAQLHNGNMQPLGAPVVPAHGKFALHTGHDHLMIYHVLGRLTVGQTVNIEVDFARAGPVDVVAKVIPYGAAPPEWQRHKKGH